MRVYILKSEDAYRSVNYNVFADCPTWDDIRPYIEVNTDLEPEFMETYANDWANHNCIDVEGESWYLENFVLLEKE